MGLISLFIFPAVSFAAWWNPLTWFNSKNDESINQSTSTNDQNSFALASCIGDAEDSYYLVWNTICSEEGKENLCSGFLGSPRDIQYTQILQTDKQQCIEIYK